MNIQLIKADLKDAPLIYEMQIKTFLPLLEIYQDYDTSPANESLEHIVRRLKQISTDYYLIKKDDVVVGAIRIVIKQNLTYRISPIFILPEYQGKGIAQIVFKMVEQKYNDATLWELDTILQEQGNCYLYEKMGYSKTGQTTIVNDKMTIVYYEKHIP